MTNISIPLQLTPKGLQREENLKRSIDTNLYLIITTERFSSPADPMFGWALVTGLISVREYSGIDITPHLEILRAKVLRYNEEYNEPWPDPNIPYDPDEIIADAERQVKERREAYESLHQSAHRA